MKLTANECFFLTQALGNVQIKASDAAFVSTLMEKVQKELEKQAKAEGLELPQPASTMGTTAPGAGPVTAK